MHYEVGLKFPRKFLSEAPALAYGRRFHLAVFRVTEEQRDGENTIARTRVDVDACPECGATLVDEPPVGIECVTCGWQPPRRTATDTMTS